ncbi:MAG: T9SS type A sorting domain-containing protein [Flavobacterium sp. JAD_PAG50586_2]|nr:MAG: T9SS type A sorting domain-containing protein [Flavobacterium sp. JAD_PAG50586_2]
MKKLYIILLFLSAFANAQIVNIPDANFKAALLSIGVDTNYDGEIQVAEAQERTMVIIDNQPLITSIEGIQSFTNLADVLLYNMPNLTNIDQLSSVPNLRSIDLSNLPMVTSLNISGWSHSLTWFRIWQGMDNVNTLNFSGFTQLHTLMLYGIGTIGPMNLSSLNLTGCTALTEVVIGTTNLAVLDVSTCTALQTLRFGDNNTSNVDVSGLTNLQTLDLRSMGISNTLHSVNANGCTALTQIDVSSNLELETLYIKNGINETLHLSHCDNLSFICADDSQITSVQSNLNSNGLTSTVVNSYCSFTPGGNYNTITGKITFDANNNGCDASDISQSGIRINITDALNTGATFSNNDGNYIFNVMAGNFTITPGLENPTWFNFSPTSAVIPYANSNNNTATRDFCFTANGIHPDLEVTIVPMSGARPGFDSDYKIIYNNKGNHTLTGNVAFAYDDAVSDFVSSSVAPNLQSTGLLTYNFSGLQPFESRSFTIKLNLNTPMETPALNDGDVVHFTATVSPLANDETPTDNTFQFNQVLVNSFDPNDIICVEGNIVSPSQIGNYLHYVINFENVGSASAQNIVVKDIINTAQFDVNTLQMLNSSANVLTRMTGNVAEFIFENINLQPQAHGNVSFKIKSKNTLVAGNIVTQSAGIYFDYNFPVITDPANTIFQTLSNPDVAVDASIAIYPNPAKGLINIECNNTIKSVQLYDVQGRILQTNLINGNQASIDISTHSNGIYFVKIISDNGIKVQKIVKD